MSSEKRKPALMLRAEFADNLVNLISSSGLSLMLIEYILKDTLNEIHAINERQYNEAIAQFGGNGKQQNESKENKEAK